mgnify:CR=1 FL=1
MADEYHILIVEDELDIVELINYNLTKEGFKTTFVSSGERALTVVKDVQPDLILLDLMLPGLSGEQVCKALRSSSETRDIPIIMMTAKSEEEDVIKGLVIGADDYVTKPFSPKVVLARIRAVLRRVQGKSEDGQVEDQVTIKELVILPNRHEVLLRGEVLELTLSEFSVLMLLVSNPGWVYTRDKINEVLHENESKSTNRAIDVIIVGLRKKLADYGLCVQTVRGIGYRFKIPV